MSSHSFPKIDQKEYLKKYLSGDKGKKKKKDKKHKKSSAAFVKVKIIDDDINHLNNGPEIDEELLLTGDDAPQIVGEYIEENPANARVPKWKSIVIKDEPEDDSDATKNEPYSWGRKSDEIKVKQEFDTRRKDKNRKPSYTSPPRSSREFLSPAKSKRDKSPSRYRTNKQSPNRMPNIKTEPQSPPKRRRERSNSPDASPPGRKNSDQSPPRRVKRPSSRTRYQSPARHRKYSDQLLPKRDKSPYSRSRCESPARHRKYSDQSPQRRDKSPDQSPPRRKRRDSDQSPPRRRRNSFEYSPSRKSKQRKETPDISPKRKSKKSIDQSPPRRKRNLDESSPRKTRNSPSNDIRRSPDQSPLRRRRKASPPSHKRRQKEKPDLSPRPRLSRWEKQDSEKNFSPPPTHKPKPGKTLEGKKSGLQDSKALQKETMQRRKEEDLLFETMSSDISGRNAEVQVRSTGRKGRRAKAANDEDAEERRRKEEHEEKKKLLYERWGKGLKQIEDHKNRMLEQQYESSKPLARYSNDEDLERHLKEQERAEDPMLEYMRKKRKEKEKQSGKPQIPRYEGPYPENRFGIRPGYRWDGVDRSNGYEKKYFAVQNEKLARQDEAYKYSVEDM